MCCSYSLEAPRRLDTFLAMYDPLNWQTCRVQPKLVAHGFIFFLFTFELRKQSLFGQNVFPL